MALPMPHRLFTVDEFEHLCNIGFFREDERIELIDGEIVEIPPPNWPHILSINAFAALLYDSVRPAGVVSVQNTVRLSHSLVLPDLSVYRNKRYNRVPGPGDVLLVVEVADSTIRDDRRVKIPLYAREGVQEAWLVDINGEIVERHTDPRDGMYRVLHIAKRGEELVSTVFPSLVISVDTVLGPVATTEDRDEANDETDELDPLPE